MQSAITPAHMAESRRLTVTRTARWDVLGSLAPATTELWIVLHGYGQLAATMVAAARWPVAKHRAFVFPEALQRFYVTDNSHLGRHADTPVGASWMTRDARDDDIADNHAYLDALLEAVRAGAPRVATTVLGFSQGAHTAARWSASRAARGDPPARLVLWGGVLPPEVTLEPGAPLRDVPTTLVAGTTDRWITKKIVAAERARAAAADFPLTVCQFDGGHRLDDATIGLLAAP
jgi:predicted esterase